MSLRVRQSIRQLQDQYDKQNATAADKLPLETLIRAWKGIQELPITDEKSFFKIGGLHGEPFRGAGWGNAQWWGGYCNHGNVLFPTWHRAYVLALENALRSIPGCGDVAMAYWDETEDYTKQNGLPSILTRETFILDDIPIRNPLRSYIFQAYVGDNVPENIDADISDYSKPDQYETVRFPFSGLVGPAEVNATDEHNAQFTVAQGDQMLNENIKTWLGDGPLVNSDGQDVQTQTGYKYEQCLSAPNYTVFSNATSATQWNDDNFNGSQSQTDPNPQPSTDAPVVSLESPHNDMHLACGGFDLRVGDPGNVDIEAAIGANGDMGENDTAGFDPLFFFHHCFVDKVFNDWQVLTGNTEVLDIIQKYPGTNSVDAQGPTPGVPGNTWLTLDTPLDPFTNPDGTPTISTDVVNIAKLGYEYASASDVPTKYKGGHLPTTQLLPGHKKGQNNAVVRVSNISRGTQPGSFLIKVVKKINGVERVVATESVLSRWHVSGCANCQTHLNVKAHIALPGVAQEDANEHNFGVNVQYRSQAPPGKPGAPKKPVQLRNPTIRFGGVKTTS